MTVPDDPDRIPSQAELDAMDLAELTHSSAESNVHYPKPVDDPGPPPPALARDAWVCWWIGAAAGLASALYMLVNVMSISDALQSRLMEGMQQTIDDAIRNRDKAPAGVEIPIPKAPADEYHGLAHTLPPAMIVSIVALLAVQFALLRAIGNHHSRNARSLFAAFVLINLVCIPVGLDLLAFSENAPLMFVIGWIQFGALVLAAVCTWRPSVGRWLPAPSPLRPTRLLRPGNA
ncbi:hypothetical protein GOARA_031_00060 [Gordonia araii NBRC 100433]|uniref:Uncharacterized protein n=1 Tax=Gordonia araii NBRC 100433 TaxID=1073574 RepID=G7H006_9ACTN|nr:hypothetical protein [Gordonia araii]NNG98812.1 hypothetical protein [Gordonia araii NBRC 100433]GAB09181.1 hypothetical protein GOARA_031_00060 [Gordonia araii NBRC 100433]